MKRSKHPKIEQIVKHLTENGQLYDTRHAKRRQKEDLSLDLVLNMLFSMVITNR